MGRWVGILFAVVGAAGCDGGSCEYEAEVVDALVTLGDPAPGANSCSNDPVVVTLSWDGESHDLTVFSGQNPPRSCLDALGLTDGATVRVRVERITSGTCSPTVVSLADEDLGACEDDCEASDGG